MLKTVAAAAFFAVPVVALSACSPNEPVATSPGTTPSVWTGSPSPSASPSESEGGHRETPAAGAGEKLTTQLKLADGTTVATADIEFAGGFATVTVETTTPGKLTPGFHGLHIHAVGLCEPPEFTSAGAHLNPSNKQHGRLNPAGPHVGDLPNLVVAASGEGGIDVTTKAFTLSPSPVTLLGDKGTSLVVHANADDEKTDPTGNSGGRIACGVITK